MRDFRSGDWLFRPALNRADREGELVHLEPKLVALLVHLVEHEGRVVSKEELLTAVWADTVVDEVALTRSISELRHILGDSARNPRYIETISKRGYRWLPPVLDAESPADPQPPARSRSQGARVAAAAGVVLLLALLAILTWSHQRSRVPKAIAVLPFQNLSGVADQEFLADGVTEQLTSDLAHLGAFRVTSRTSAMAYKGVLKPLPHIARELGVDAVVEGSVARSGDKLRVTAQLIDAGTDQHLYSQSWDCDIRNLLLLQRDIARSIASAAGAPAGEDDRTPRNTDPDSLRAFVAGQYFLNKRGEADLRRAVEEFGKALDADPSSSRAYAGLANAYAQLGYVNSIAPDEVFSKGKAAAEKAIALDDSNAEAHAVLGFIHMYYDWAFQSAEREFQRAITLNPSLAAAHHYYAIFLAAMLRPADAEREIVTARALDPLSVLVATDMGFILYYDRDYVRAASVLRDAVSMNPKAAGAHFWLARVYQAQGRYDEAEAEYRAGGSGISEWPPALAGLGYMYGLLGKRAEAAGVLHEMEEMSKTHYVTPYAAALVHLGLGDEQRTLDLLQDSLRERANWLVWLLKDPRWDAMRGNPRFRDIVTSVGFPADSRARSPEGAVHQAPVAKPDHRSP